MVSAPRTFENLSLTIEDQPPWTTKERFVSRLVLTNHRARKTVGDSNSVAVQAYRSQREMKV